MPSLRRLDRETTRLVVPAGTGRLAARQGFESVAELSPGQQLRIGDAVVNAVPAVHHGGRNPLGVKVQPLGYLVEGAGVRVYFAGDTDLFDAMADLGELDLALLPVWGWWPPPGR